MQKVLRFVIRGDGKESGLVLGAALLSHFQPDTIYQVEEILGEYIIKPIGPMAMKPEKWGMDVSSIIEHHEPYLLTPVEYAEYCERKNSK